MERFQNIDWHSPLEDMIDNVFISDERLERESAMYRIMTDSFTDPFEGIESDYANVDIELIKKYLREDGEEVSSDTEDENQQEVKDGDNSCTEEQETSCVKEQGTSYVKEQGTSCVEEQGTSCVKEQGTSCVEEQGTSCVEEQGTSCVKEQETSCVEEQEKSYVPGIRKLLFCFPRRSRLDKIQQAMCLRVLLRLSNNEKKKMNIKERKELNQYMALQETISEEQKEFLEFVKSKWNDTFDWPIKSNQFITKKWEAKMWNVKRLPRYYIESINIPLSVQKVNFIIKDVKVILTSCLRQESFSEVVLPKLDKRYTLYMEPSTLLERYLPCVIPDTVTQHFRLPASQDTCCESFAIESEADFVISSSGLKCLLSNIDPDHSNSWLIPVVVRSYHGKNIVYVDKKLPLTMATVPQKNTWVYKYILRYHFIDVKDESSEKTKHTKEETLEKVVTHSDLDDNDCNDYLKIYEEDLYLSDTDVSEQLDDLTSSKTNSTIDKQQNVSYNLFTIGSMESPKHERIKHGVKEYRILVRTKTDGIEISNGKSQSLILAPKMEHQLELGAEAITLEEGLYQWASLKFRPGTSLARVRIAADTSEVIQIERHTTMSLSDEIKRLYNIKVEDSLSILHNIIEGLSSLTPGQYILRHVPQNGPFAYVYKHTTEYRKNVFDLHTVCQSKFQTISKTPWPPIDNMMTTPALRCFQRMPAMFYPILHQKLMPNRPRGRPKKNANVTNIQVPAFSPRRSIRLRKTNTFKKTENAA